MNRIAEVLGLDPCELRLKNANRIGDTSANAGRLHDPSTVPAMLAAADKVGDELPADYRAMTSERRAAATCSPSTSSRSWATPSNGGEPLMAKHKGRGISTIEYPTGMNQNGDPSQAWVKLKPDGRVDVFAGTVDIGQGSRTVHTQIVADTLGVPYDWVTMDNTNTDSSPAVHRHLRLARHVHRRQRRRASRPRGRASRILAIASQELEIDPADLEIADGEVVAKGSPDRRLGVADVAAAATWTYGELITGTGAWMIAVLRARPRHRARASRTRRSRTRRASPTSRSTTRPARCRSSGSSRSTTSAGRSTRCSSRARSRAAR